VHSSGSSADAFEAQHSASSQKGRCAQSESKVPFPGNQATWAVCRALGLTPSARARSVLTASVLARDQLYPSWVNVAPAWTVCFAA